MTFQVASFLDHAAFYVRDMAWHISFFREVLGPFGIYRNQKSDPLGSNTNGLQNYDDLYADVLLWAREGLGETVRRILVFLWCILSGFPVCLRH